MFKFLNKINLLLIFYFSLLSNFSQAEIVKEINIQGNQRISSETVKMFSGVSINDDLLENDLNQILKKLYNTNFFETVSVRLSNDILIIKVE